MPTLNLTTPEIEARLAKAQASASAAQLQQLENNFNDEIVSLWDETGTINTKVNELFTSASNGKALIASAITGKGISTAADATFQTMANNIGSIPTGKTVTDLGEITGTYSSSSSVYFTITSFPRYSSITIANIICQITSVQRASVTGGTSALTYAYTNTNGRVTLSSGTIFASSTTGHKARIYIVE